MGARSVGARMVVGHRRVGSSKLRAFFPHSATISILSSLSWGLLKCARRENRVVCLVFFCVFLFLLFWGHVRKKICVVVADVEAPVFPPQTPGGPCGTIGALGRVVSSSHGVGRWIRRHIASVARTPQAPFSAA